MADPLSISFGVFGAAAVVLHAAHKLKSLIDDVQGAPEAINLFSTDLQALQIVLGTLKESLNGRDVAVAEMQTRIFSILDQPLQNCGRLLDVTSEKLKSFVRHSPTTSKSRWKTFVWAYREKDFVDLRNLLLSHKASLEVALGAANLCVFQPQLSLFIGSLLTEQVMSQDSQIYILA